jgi:hypothetical protein
MEITLPSRFYQGRTLRVISFNCAEVELALRFGVKVEKNIIVEGVQKTDVPFHSQRTAQHALVVLIGGKRLVVQVDDDEKKDGFILGRVYLAEKVHGNPVGLVIPKGLETPMLEVGTFMRWLIADGLSIDKVKAVLNGKSE